MLIACAAFASAGLYALIGRANLNGRASRDTSVRMLALWWFSAAALSAIWGAEVALAALSVRDARVHIVLFQLMGVTMTLGAWGLTHFLAVLVTGKRNLMASTATAAAVLFVAIQVAMAFADEVVVQARPWDVEITMSFGGAEPLVNAIFFALWLPFLLAIPVFAYAAVKAGPGGARRRAGTVAATWGFGFLAQLLAWAFGLWETPALQAVTAFLAPALAGLILAAYAAAPAPRAVGAAMPVEA